METTAPPSGRARLLTLAFVVASIAAVQAPASAAPARTTFSQPSPVHLGDSSPQASAPSATAIEIPDSAAPADPYPSTVSFDRPGVITDVDVAITGITHESPDDLQLLLVGPEGDQALLMAHVSNGEAVDDIDISFDDEGMLFETNQPLEDTAAYQPTSVAPVDFPGGAPDLDGNTALGVFNGTSPVGDWQLFVHDSVAGNGGTIGSWNLSFELATSPYPSTLSVSGIGEVTDVDVSLHDIDSSFPRDSDVLLVGPQGHQSVLMSDVGGTVAVSGVDLTLDDSAAELLPVTSALTSGSFKPTNEGNSGVTDVFPAVPDPSQAADLSVFNGSDPNGVWSLYAVDDLGDHLSAILGGWSLDIEWDQSTVVDQPPSHPVALDTTAPTGTVTLSGGAAYATRSTADLSLTATDTGPNASGVRQMRFSNDNKAFSAWQPYATTAGWTLATGKDGARTVYAQFADGVGNVSPVLSDTVTLDTTAPTAKKITPAKNAQGVSAKTKIKVTASEKLDPATVTKKSVLLKQGSKKIKAKVSLKKGTTIVLKPKKPLADGKYKVTVTTLVSDLAGNAFDAKKKKGIQTLRWTFTV